MANNINGMPAIADLVKGLSSLEKFMKQAETGEGFGFNSDQQAEMQKQMKDQGIDTQVAAAKNKIEDFKKNIKKFNGNVNQTNR
jgi:hypothetical protein